jgi:hypothetical protein
MAPSPSVAARELGVVVAAVMAVVGAHVTV